MIYVSEDQLTQVEYLIEQSIKGNHVLFEAEIVRRVFSKPHTPLDQNPIDIPNAYAVEPHIERIISLPTLAEKRAYLENLDHQTHENVVRTYFNIVENNLYEKLEVKH